MSDAIRIFIIFINIMVWVSAAISWCEQEKFPVLVHVILWPLIIFCFIFTLMSVWGGI